MADLVTINWFDDFKVKFITNFIVNDRWKLLLTGLGNTLLIAFFAVLLGLVLGFLVAIVRSTSEMQDRNRKKKTIGSVIFKIIDVICKVYLTVIRGTPVLVQLMIIYFVIFESTGVSKIFAAVVAFGVNSGAYVAEIIRSGIMSIDKGQFEAGRSLGFNYPKTMIYIILPQALKNALPALANEFIVLLKETSVSGFIGLTEITRAGDIIRSRTFEPLLPLLAVALIYLAIVMVLTKLVGLLERRLRRSEH